MALIKRADADELAREALVLDLGDIERHGRSLRKRAESEASEIVAAGRAERERLIADATEVGRAAGHKEGLEAGLAEGRERGRQEAERSMQAELEQLRKAWGEALESFRRERDRMLLEAREDIVTLARLVAERVTKRALELDDGVVGAQVAEAVAIAARSTRLVVSVSPGDEAIARRELDAVIAGMDGVHAELSVDARVSRGSCVVRTAGGGRVEATVEAQLARLLDAVGPAPACGSRPASGSGPGEPCEEPGPETGPESGPGPEIGETS